MTIPAERTKETVDEMRAALYDRYGPPEVLYEGRRPMLSPAPGEVLVKVHAISVNGGELHSRAGKLRMLTDLMQRGFPKTVGIDFAGEIVAVRSRQPGPAVGDRVWGALSRTFGSAVEYLAVRPRQLSLVPSGIDLVEAAALPVATTAITALRDKTRLRPGERLLVIGGAGGVGSAAVQLGKHFGAHVTALASARTLDFVREIGADEVHDYAVAGPAELGPFDVVMDTKGVAQEPFRRLLTPGGRMVAIAFDLGRPVASLSYVLASAVFGSRRVRFFSGDPTHRDFAALTRYVEAGALRPLVHAVHPLADIAGAHRALEAGGVRGKIVVRIA